MCSGDAGLDPAASARNGDDHRQKPDGTRSDLPGPPIRAGDAVERVSRIWLGTIVNIGSDLSRRFQPRMAVYAATKFGLLGFSGSLMREVKDRGVKVVALMSGSIDTSWGGFAPEGSRDARYALRPDELAAVIENLLDLPEHLIVHELVIHPSGQDGF
jgi:short-subunit dehydrogenase